MIMAQRMGIITAEERATLKGEPGHPGGAGLLDGAHLEFPPVYGRDQQAVYSFADGDKFDKAKPPIVKRLLAATS